MMALLQKIFTFFNLAPKRTTNASEADAPHFGFRLVIYLGCCCVLILIIWIFVGKVDDVIKLRGKVIPRNGILAVQAQTGGTVKYFLVEEGDVVPKGRVLVQLDTDLLRQQLAGLEKEKGILTDQTQKLRLSPGSLTQGMEKQNELLRLDSEIARTKEMLEKTVIQAPFDAVVASTYELRPGSMVETGKPVISLVPKNSPLDIEAKATGTDLQNLRPGLPARIAFDTFPYQTFGTINGMVMSVSPSTVESNKPPTEKESGSFRVVVFIADSDINHRRLLPGMDATIWVVAEKRTIAKWLWGQLSK